MPNETMDTISATELVRNLSAVVDNVRISGQSLYITKGSQTVAQLSPPPKQGFPAAKLSDLLNSLPSLGDDAKDFSADIEKLKQHAQLPDNPWD
jgi:antitoxin (DNA-binding transcriptional repressor) of toxin-antitoxin stability system